MPPWYSGPDPLNLGGSTPESGGGAIPWINLSGEGRLYTGPGSGAAGLDSPGGSDGEFTGPPRPTGVEDPQTLREAAQLAQPGPDGGNGSGVSGINTLLLYGALAIGAMALLGNGGS